MSTATKHAKAPVRDNAVRVELKRKQPTESVNESVPEYDEWDEQMARDAAAGKLDFLSERARKAFREGKTLPVPLPE